MLWTLNYTRTLSSPNRFIWKMEINQKFSWQWGQGRVRGRGRGWNHAAAAETGQTGSWRAKRHSEGKRERHWAISSQSGCTGPMGEGKGLAAAALLFLSGRQDDVGQGRRYLPSSSHSSDHNIISSAVVSKCYDPLLMRYLISHSPEGFFSSYSGAKRVMKMSEHELYVEFKRTRATCRLLVASGWKTLKSSNACRCKGLNRTVEGL